MEWLTQLSQAIAYVEDNLAEEISYDRAAEIACCSPYYFQRMFSYVAGISLSEYIRRRRMTQAAFELQSTSTKVLEIACKYGYASPTSFNRAFQGIHGISPAVARLHGTRLNAYPPIKFSVSVIGGNSMPYFIEVKDAMRFVGFRIPLGEDMDKNQKIVPEFWNRVMEENRLDELLSLSDSNPKTILGITTYKNPEEIYYYIATSTEKSLPVGMHECKVPGATWVVFESSGPFKDSVQSIFRRFLTEWLPFSGYEYAMLPDIEVYPVNKDSTKQGRSQVWIAIKKESKDELSSGN